MMMPIEEDHPLAKEEQEVEAQEDVVDEEDMITTVLQLIEVEVDQHIEVEEDIQKRTIIINKKSI
jgi:hypothetical protein